MVDGNRMSRVVKIQSDQEVSEVEANAIIAAFCEYLSLARSAVAEMMLVTTPTALGENPSIIMMLVMIPRLV